MQDCRGAPCRWAKASSSDVTAGNRVSLAVSMTSHPSGIGPTLAIKILSGVEAVDLIHSIRRGEVEKLVRIPGVGKKTAERMVLELRDKLPAVTGEEPAAPAETGLQLLIELTSGRFKLLLWKLGVKGVGRESP